MNKIVIVDDKSPAKTTVAYGLKLEIEDLTDGEYSAELLEGVIISNALPAIVQLEQDMREKNDNLIGLLIDLVDETHKVLDAGAILLDNVKAHAQLRNIPVVLYTTKYTKAPADLRKRGAKALVRRKANWVEKVLDAFEIPY